MNIPNKTIHDMNPVAGGVKDSSVGSSTEKRENLLEINDLHVWFELKKWGFRHAGFVRAVDGVTFRLRNSETIAIVGESGCGKTSLIRTILLLNRPTKGEVKFEGQPINNITAAELKKYRSNVGYVQQDPYGAMPPFMNVQTILEEPLKINGVSHADERRRRVVQALEEVKMSPAEEFMPKFPHQISGGQQQRVVIARAMIMNPKLMIADEPVSMLDASVRVEVLKLLRSIQEEHHLGVIYITHDLSTVRYFSESIFVMYAGQIIEKGTVEHILKNTAHPYTFALLEATSDPDAHNALVQKVVPPGEPPSLVNPPSGCRYHSRCPRFMPGVCDQAAPPDLEIEPGHHVMCWLHSR